MAWGVGSQQWGAAVPSVLRAVDHEVVLLGLGFRV